MLAVCRQYQAMEQKIRAEVDRMKQQGALNGPQCRAGHRTAQPHSRTTQTGALTGSLPAPSARRRRLWCSRQQTCVASARSFALGTKFGWTFPNGSFDDQLDKLIVAKLPIFPRAKPTKITPGL